MSSLVLLQIVFNLVLGLGIYILWLRLKKPPQDDPRLSRGLQLLQSKISVLEDLSDRTEVQVNQLTTLLETKARQVQAKIEEAQKEIHHVGQAIESSREMAEIFQDKIPHAEIVERQNTIKYVRAARMAHSGQTIAEIAEQVDLPVGEIEFIAKVNKDQLMFDQEALPEWAREATAKGEAGVQSEQTPDEKLLSDGAEDFEFRGGDLAGVFDVPTQEYDSLKKLGDEFRQACKTYDEQQTEPVPEPVDPSKILNAARRMTDKLVTKASAILHDKPEGQTSKEVQAHVPSEIVDAPTFDFDRKVEQETAPLEAQPVKVIKQELVAESSPAAEASLSFVIDEANEGPEIIMPGEQPLKEPGKSAIKGFQLNPSEEAPSEGVQTRFDILDDKGNLDYGVEGDRDQIRRVAFPKIDVNEKLG